MAKKRTIYRDNNGNRLPSVTGITGVLHKPALLWWVAKMTTEHVERTFEAGRAYLEDEIAGMLEEAKRAHLVKRDAAKDFGSDVHGMLDAYISGQELKSLDGDMKKVLDNFKRVTAGWNCLGSEIIVVNHKVGYGGTADAIMEKDGEVSLIDFKTSGEVWPEHELQITMYTHAEPEREELRDAWKKIKRGLILHLNKETMSWAVLERDIKEHKKYIPGFKAVYDWDKMFNRSY